MKHRVLTVVKILIPILILAWLLTKEWDAIQRLVERPKDHGQLLASLACMLVAVLLTFVRWFLLVRALEIPFTLRAAFRLGFLGFLFNFVGPSAVGGDLFKAYCVAKEQTHRRAEAVATILLDRVVGMYSLFVVATVAIQIIDAAQLSGIGSFLRLVSILCAVGTAGIVLLLLPARFTDWLLVPMTRWPFVGSILSRVRAALELYRRRRARLVAIGVISVLAHILIAFSIHFTDRAIHPETPTLAEHLIISPLATVATAAPVPGGLGTYEFAMDYFYQRLPVETMEKGQGLSVAVIYRVMTILIASVGLAYYLLNRAVITDAVSAMETEHAEA